MIKDVTDVFTWLMNSGVLLIALSCIGALYKVIYPSVRAKIKNTQQQQLGDIALDFVTKFASNSGLTKSDRFQASVHDLTQFAKVMKINWLTTPMAEAIVESAYQTFKLSGKDNHLTNETTVAEDEIDKELGDIDVAESDTTENSK